MAPAKKTDGETPEEPAETEAKAEPRRRRPLGPTLRIDQEAGRLLMAIKHELELDRGRSVSMSDAFTHLIRHYQQLTGTTGGS